MIFKYNKKINRIIIKMKSLVEFIKSIKENKEGDKIPVEVYTYLQELLYKTKNKDMKDEIDSLVNDDFDCGETSMVNINGGITDKIKISGRELCNWCQGLVNDDMVTFLIVNVKKDFLLCINGAENRCYTHNKGEDTIDKDFFDNIETEIRIVYRSHDGDPTKEDESYVTYSKKYIEEYEPDLFDDWVETTADDLANAMNLGELADNMLNITLDKKWYNEYKKILSDKNTFIYMSY